MSKSAYGHTDNASIPKIGMWNFASMLRRLISILLILVLYAYHTFQWIREEQTRGQNICERSSWIVSGHYTTIKTCPQESYKNVCWFTTNKWHWTSRTSWTILREDYMKISFTFWLVKKMSIRRFFLTFKSEIKHLSPF